MTDLFERESKREILLIAAEPNRNHVHANTKSIGITLQGWINDSRIIVVEIPYFCFNRTEFFNTLTKFFVHNLRAIIRFTTND